MSQTKREILNRIRSVVGNSSDQQRVKETLIFCFEDGEPIVGADFDQYRFKHGDHTSDRAFIFYPTTKFEFTDEGDLKHFSAGAILWKEQDGRRLYCMMRGRTHPIGKYSFPAGHIERGEDTQSAALREAWEETGLGVVSVGPVPYRGDISCDPCRRGSDLHEWVCYVCECVGEPRLCKESDLVGWFTLEDALELSLVTPCRVFLERHQADLKERRK